MADKAKLIFNSPQFNHLDKYKADEVKYLLFNAKGKNKFAFCIGVRGNEVYAPFSAPCSTVVPLHNKYSLESLESAIVAFDDWQKKLGYNKVRLILPPDFYNYKVVTAMQNILLRYGYSIMCHDINYALNLEQLSRCEYSAGLPNNGRKNLRIALESNLQFFKCQDINDKEEAYNIIKINRQRRGFPLRMTWEQVSETIKIVNHDMFIVKKDGIGIASALVYQVTEDICSVVYWGDIEGVSTVKPINFLAYQLIQYYTKKGIKILDIGISTEDGIPNYGLCDFKESIGCFLSSKIIFTEYND